MPLTATLSVGMDATLVSALDLAEVRSRLAKTYDVALQSGVGAGQADVLWHDQRVLNASASEDLDLAGTLAGLLGGTVTFVKVKGLIIAAAPGNTNNVVVGNATSNGFNSWVGGATHTVTVRPGAVLALFAGAADAAGYAVTAGTGDLLHVANGGAGTPVTYDVVVLGTSA